MIAVVSRSSGSTPLLRRRTARNATLITLDADTLSGESIVTRKTPASQETTSAGRDKGSAQQAPEETFIPFGSSNRVEEESVLRLQRTVGNRAVGRLLAATRETGISATPGPQVIQRRGYFARGEAGHVDSGRLTTTIVGTKWVEMGGNLFNPLSFALHSAGSSRPLAIIGTGREIVGLLQSKSDVRVINDLRFQGGDELVDDRQRLYWNSPQVFKTGITVLNPAAEFTKSAAIGSAGLAPGGPAMLGDPGELLEFTDVKEGGFLDPIKKRLAAARARKQQLKAEYIIIISPYPGPGLSEIGRGPEGVGLNHVLARALSAIPSWRTYTQR